jgi:hypothetical protein
MFAERAVTIGRGKLSVGATYQRTTYNRFEGQRLDDGSIKFYLRHEECCTPGAGGGGGGGRGGGAGTILTPDGSRLTPSFEGDVIEAALSLEATTNTVAFSTNYGLTSRWDVGFTVPVVRVTLDAGVRATILRLATSAIPQIHTFEVGNPAATERTLRQRGTATGLGDVLLRTKYRLANLAGGGVAAAVDVRLPTGDQANLLGSGTQVKTFLIASTQTGRLAPHVNVGYTAVSGGVTGGPLLSGLGGDTHLPDEVTYAAGVEFLADPRVTIAADILGRTLRGAGRLELSSKPFAYQGATAVETVFLDEFTPRTGSLNLMLGTVGVKFNPFGNLLVSGSVLFPLNDAGLRSQLSTVVGVDYAF